MVIESYKGSENSAIVHAISSALPSVIVFRDRQDAHEKVFAYYSHLERTFPRNINWDGNEFEYTEWDAGSFVINYDSGEGHLSYTNAMFLPDERKTLSQMVSGVSPQEPADIILPIYNLEILVPFLDVKRLGSIWFASNE